MSDARRPLFLNALQMMISDGSTNLEDALERFVTMPVADMWICAPTMEGPMDPYSTAENWAGYAQKLRMKRMYELLLQTCEPFNQAGDNRFAERMQEVIRLQQDCIGDQLWPQHPEHTQKLRDAGQLEPVFELLMGLVDREIAETIPTSCLAVDCTVEALFGDRSEAVMAFHQKTGYWVQDWDDSGEEIAPVTQADLTLLESTLTKLLDCDRLGGMYQADFFVERRLRVQPIEIPDAGRSDTAIKISRYFMYDHAGNETPDRLLFVLGHEMAHAAADELTIRKGRDLAVFDSGTIPDPAQYHDPAFVDVIGQIANLELDMAIVGPSRAPTGFNAEDVASGMMNPLTLMNGRDAPFLLNPAVLVVDDVYAEQKQFFDGVIRSENVKGGFSEAIADLLIAYKEFPHFFFEGDVMIAPRAYLFIKENYFDGEQSPALTAAQLQEVEHVEGLSESERNQRFQEQAQSLYQSYCAANPDDCEVLPTQSGDNARQVRLMQWLTALAQRSRPERLQALTTILDELQLPYEEDVHDLGDGRSLTNVIVRVGEGPLAAGFSAHYDAKGGSRGAVDNGSGVAALLELARDLGEQQLNRQFVLYFFDLEEEWATGSQAYVGANQNNLPPVVFNLDMCGYGDTLTVGPTEAASSQNLEQLREAAITAQTNLEEFSYALGGSDHESFLQVSTPAFLITLLPSEDVTLLRNIFEEDDFSEIPSIFTTKDSQQDYLGRIQPRSVERCVEFLLALTTP